MFWVSLAAVLLALLLRGIHLRHSLRESDKIATNRARKNRNAENLFDEAPSPDTVSWPAKKRNRSMLTAIPSRGWFKSARILTTLGSRRQLQFSLPSSWAVFRNVHLGWPSVIGWVVWFAASASTDALFARAGSKFFTIRSARASLKHLGLLWDLRVSLTVTERAPEIIGVARRGWLGLDVAG
jgi:hypothetical protein